MKGKNKGRKFMQLPGTYDLKFVKQEDIQEYLAKGYIFSSINKREKVYKMKNI